MEQLRQQVIVMQRKVNDCLDKPSDPAAVRLKRELQGLEDDLQVRKSVGTVEDRVKRIIGILQGDARGAQIMNIEQLESFKEWFEGLRQSVRKLG